MSDELKPCPFCGGKPTYDRNFVICETCALRMERAIVYPRWHEMDELRHRWNARAAVTDEQFAMAVHDGRPWQVVRECRNVYDGREFACSECGTQWHLLTRGDVFVEWEHVRTPIYCPNCGAKVVE